ncbi:hypothetical protein BWU74_00400 [Paraburkholderia caledonica]|nr:hypothetical protein BWU74_00400 [Burkholderia sp. Bk]
MSSSRSVIVCEVGGGSMRLKTFQAREYCGGCENSFPFATVNWAGSALLFRELLAQIQATVDALVARQINNEQISDGPSGNFG